jgi:cobalamin synthase
LGISITILILAVLWAAFFLWPFLQRRLSGRNRDSIGDFSRRVSKLGGVVVPVRRRALPAIQPPRPVAFRAAGRPPASTGLPMSPVAQKRRRDALAAFVVLALAALALAVVSGSTVLWAVQFVADALLVAFVVALVLLARRAHERKARIHFLPQPVPAQSSALVLRRTASS